MDAVYTFTPSICDRLIGSDDIYCIIIIINWPDDQYYCWSVPLFVVPLLVFIAMSMILLCLTETTDHY